MNTLGIGVERDSKAQNKINFDENILKIIKNFLHCGKHKLSLLGRTLHSFVWGSAFNRMRHSTLTTDYDNQRLRMPDIKSTHQSLRLPWIGRILKKAPGAFY